MNSKYNESCKKYSFMDVTEQHMNKYVYGLVYIYIYVCI